MTKNLCNLWLKIREIRVNPWLMNYLPFLLFLCLKNPFNQRNPLLKSVKSVFYKALFWSFYANFCAFSASLRLKRTVFTRPKTCLPHEIAQRYLFGVISASKNLCNLLLKICAICGKNPCNPWLIKDLRLCKPLYNCKETFTDVKKTLQIKLFLQNKAKFRKSQMNVNKVLTRDYDQKDTWSIRKKQSQTNPNKAKSKKAKMNVTSIITVDYENKPPIPAPKKQSQISKRQKPMQTSLPKGIMKITALSAPPKQTQTKPTCRGVASGEAGTNPICLSFRCSAAKLIFMHKRLTVPYKSVRYLRMFVLLIKDCVFWEL